MKNMFCYGMTRTSKVRVPFLMQSKNNERELNMAYNTQQNKGYTKPQQKPAQEAAAPVAQTEAAPAGKGNKPAFNLYIQKVGEEEKTKLTGLFKDVSKKGDTYFKGKDSEGNKYIVFIG